MSLYKFAPSPDLSTKEEVFATWVNGFTDDDIKNIINLGESYDKSDGSIGGQNDGEDISRIRKSKVSWIQLNDTSGWLYDRMAYITRQLNGQFFDFDLFGFVEHMQYTEYGHDGDHYTWHMDKGASVSGGGSPRKLSLILQLSDPSEYEGGDIELFTASVPSTMIKQKGLIIAFPSWILHRVTPVTKGIRRTLVIWVAGPKFR